MRFFVSSSRTRRKAGSHLAMAIALATGTAMLSGVVAEPAFAQRDKKKKAGKAEYSKEFIGVFQPLQEVVNAEGGDIASVSGQFPNLIALSVSPDEKIAAGGLIYNAGARSGNQQMQLEGMKLMLSSGKVEPEQTARYSFIAYQLANAQGDYAGSRVYLQQAIDGGFTADTVNKPVMQIAMAESFIAENRFAEGLDYLANAIRETKAAGQPVEESWYRRGLSIGYNNEVVPQVYDFAAGWVEAYPSPTNWRDAVNIARNLNEYASPEMLDLLRLSLRVDALQSKQEYIDYVEAADPRRLPKEVKQVIEQGYANGRVSRDDIYIADSLKMADSRIASDRADLPALERDANASGAALRTVVAAGDAFLSYDQYAKAEGFFTKALTMPGVNSNEALTRLGIAQAEQGKFDAARASFAKVTGPRVPIARLWTAYVNQRASAAAPAVAPAAPAAAEPATDSPA